MREGDKLFLFVPAEFPKANLQSQYFMDILEPEWQVWQCVWFFVQSFVDGQGTGFVHNQLM